MSPQTSFGLVFGPIVTSNSLSLQLMQKTIIIISASLRESDWHVLAEGWEGLLLELELVQLPKSPAFPKKKCHSALGHPGHVQCQYFGSAQM